MQLPATTTPVQPTTTALALTLPTDTTATATASAIPTEMAYATSLRWADVTMQLPATTTPVQPTTTALALTLPTDTTATETASAIPTEMAYATSLRWADVTMQLPATTTPVQPTTTALAFTLPTDTTATETAWLMPTEMAYATSLRWADVTMQLPATTTPVQPTTTALALTLPTDTTATVTASAIPTEMAYATSLRWADVTMQLPATTTPVQPTTTAPVLTLPTDTIATVTALADADGDGICDEFEVGGCDDAAACNYDAGATDNDGSCTYAADGYDCDGNCLSDTDGDGICDEFEVGGCTDPAAANYDPLATDDDASCLDPICIDPDACNYTEWNGNDYCLIVQPYQVHDSGELDGFVTYRIYIKTQNADDFISSVSGDSDFPTRIMSSGSFFQSSFGGLLGSDQNPALFGFFPTAAYDSYVTIGLTESAAAGEGNINVIESVGNPWGNNFENGQDLLIDDAIGGGWFIFNGNTNGIAGDDEQVLLAQVTTDGALSGSLYVQVFVNGDVANDDRILLDIEEACAAPGGPEACDFPEDGYDCDGNCLSDTDGDGVCDEFEVGGCDDAAACNYDAGATDNDGSCSYAADGYDCDGNCLSDTDGDGVCDEFEVDGCDDAAACNYDAGATDNDGSCTYAADGYDCDGNCLADADGDGICDPFEIAGCQDELACNFDAEATDEDGSCTYAEEFYDCDGNCLNDADGDYVCDENEIAGCINPNACNYVDPSIVTDLETCVFAESGYDCDGNCLNDADGDGVCDEFEVEGCLDPVACNYNPDTTEEIDCIYVLDGYDCDGICLNDSDGDGVCDEFEIEGCTDPAACNYDEANSEEDGSCDFCSCGEPLSGYTLQVEEHAVGGIEGMTTYRFYIGMENASDFLSAMYGNLQNPLTVSTSEGFYNDTFATGATADGINPAFFPLFPSLEYDSWVTIGTSSQVSGSQVAASTVESSFQPWVGAFNSTSGMSGQDFAIDDWYGGAWYVTNGAPNGVADAENQRVLIMQLTTAGDLSGTLNAQIFPDGMGADEIFKSFSFDGAGTFNANGESSSGAGNACGCTDPEASNYDEDAEYENDSCLYPGCTDATACNYDASATTDDASCNYADEGYDCDGNCLVDTDGDGVCDQFEVAGCMDATACNYNADATDADESCEYAVDGYDCDGNCLVDTDGDGVCDQFEVAGCMDATACNYDADATDADESCEYAEDGYDCDGNCLSDTDGDGICDEFEVGGCDDAAACNYDAGATDNDGSCTYAADGYDCDGNCLSDTDGDGICDEFEVGGCTDPAAANYDPLATDDDASCLDPICIDPDACNYTEWNGNDYCLIVQPYQVHDSGELDGFVTYRIYIKTQNADDFISSVSGDSDFPTRIMSSGSFFQSSFGGLLGSDQNPALFGFFPTAAYDSYVTIGLTESAAAGEGNINVIESVGNPWGNNFENGQDLLIDDAIGGGWFIFNGNTNGIAGDDEQVLLAQVTTDGALSGSLYVQVFVNGDVANDDRILLDIEEACAAPGGPEACDFPENGYDCDGNCLSDTDGDGVCDEFEVGGCDDAAACNYDAGATDNDGSCHLRCRRIRLRRQLPQRYRRRWRMRRV